MKEERGDLIKYRDYRTNFEKWIRNRVSNKHASTILRYLDRFCDCFETPEDLEEIVEKSTSRKHMVIALRNFINFLEEKEIITPEQANRLRRPLKTVRSKADAYFPSDEEVINAFNRFNDVRYRIVFKVLAYSGIRITEAEKFLNEFDKRRLMVNGNIAKYPLFFERSSKKSYFVYLPSKFAENLERVNITHHSIENYFSRRGFCAKYLRKWNYNFLILNGVPESVADFIQGRTSITVGSMHYLAKVRQADEWYSRIVDKFEEIFG